jgi:hypothetical protein
LDDYAAQIRSLTDLANAARAGLRVEP